MPRQILEARLSFDLRERAQWADKALRALTDPERQRVTQGYFPTSLEILGVSAPKMRTVLRQILVDVKGEAPETVVELAGPSQRPRDPRGPTGGF